MSLLLVFCASLCQTVASSRSVFGRVVAALLELLLLEALGVLDLLVDAGEALQLLDDVAATRASRSSRACSS